MVLSRTSRRERRATWLVAALLALGAWLLPLPGRPGVAEAKIEGPAGAKLKASGKSKGKGKTKGSEGLRENGCRVQAPQRFLMRRSYIQAHSRNPAKHEQALRWLVSRYGNAGDPRTTAMNPDNALAHAKTTQFFGMPISLHEKVAPALSCVEKRIRATCHGRAAYEPKAIGGFRSSNTYRGSEVSNHLLGLAIDIDPEQNPCCGCVRPWSESPLCSKKVRSAYERAALPRCWVDAFARYGFDWLGHDILEDTMHFEFLGDPDRIEK